MYRVDLVYMSQVRAQLEALEHNIDDWTPLWDDIGQTMSAHVAETFATEGFGYWDPLQMQTVATKERMGFPYPEDPMIRTGNLLESLLDPEQAGEVEQGRSTLGTFTEKAYSYGTEVRNSRGQTYAEFHADHPDHNPELPIRDPIMVTPKLLAEIEDDAREFLRESLRKAGIEPKG